MASTLTDIDTQSKIIIAGKPGMGKTTLITRIIYENYRKFKYIVVFCPSKRLGTKDYECIGNSNLVQADASAANIKRFMDYQETLAKKYNRGDLEEPPDALFILDDILDSALKLYGKDKQQFVGLLADSRHLHISIVFIVQTLHGTIPPAIRDQVNYLYVFYTGVDGKVLKQIVNAPVRRADGKVMNAGDYETQVSELADKPHTCLVYVSTKQKQLANKPLKVTPAPPFKIEWEIQDDEDEDDD